MIWRTRLITKEIDLNWKSELAGTADWLAHWHDSEGSRLAKYVILFPIHLTSQERLKLVLNWVIAKAENSKLQY